MNIVPEPVIRQQAITSLQEALRNVPGITFTAAEGGVSASQIFWLRGFPAGGDLFLDGVRDIGEYNRDLFNIDRVEVLKGPSALAFGRGSTGGVINQVTKIADLLPRERGRLLARDQRRASRHRRRELRHQPEHGVPLPAAGREAPKPTATRSTTTRSASRRRSASASARISTSPCNTSTCRPRPRPTTASRTSAPSSATRCRRCRSSSTTASRTTTSRTPHQHRDAHVNWKVSDTVGLRNVTRWASYRRDMEASIGGAEHDDARRRAGHRNTPYDQLATTLTHNKARDNDDSVFINQTDVTWKVATGAIKHTVTGGLDLAWEKLDRDDLCVRRQSRDRQDRGAVDRHVLPQPGHQRVAQLHEDAADPQHLQGRHRRGVRAGPDRVHAAVEGRARRALRLLRLATQQTALSPLGANTGPFERTDNLWSGRAGLIWQPTNAQSYYVSWSNGYNPSGELGVYGASSTNLNALNQFLDPEETYNYEVGATGTSRRRCACARRSSASRRPMRATPIRWTASSSSQASAASTAWSSSSPAASRRIGTSTPASPTWTARSSRAIR